MMCVPAAVRTTTNARAAAPTNWPSAHAALPPAHAALPHAQGVHRLAPGALRRMRGALRPAPSDPLPSHDVLRCASVPLRADLPWATPAEAAKRAPTPLAIPLEASM